MTPEQLKASILQYAIQGKLVEQRPEEGTGEELYQYYQDIEREDTTETKLQKIISKAYTMYRDNASAITATINLLKAGRSLVPLFAAFG